MEYIADLHIHSPYSRATSKESTLTGLAAWARIKGIHVVGTGDFTHPGWFAHLKEYLEPTEPGFFKLKNDRIPQALPDTEGEEIPVRFMLSTEISSIYKRGGRVRKIHNVLYAPDFESVERMNSKLAAIGNIESDGRPILGLDARDLLEIFLEQVPDGFLVPAHIWTPWFSLFGSKSGFDAIEDCFGDLTQHIFALETGLSSDPDMNRLVSSLDRFALISNSDCHSPSKLGREANLFDAGFDYYSLRESLRKNKSKHGFKGTIEFFPEEGKYHFDGHRKCEVCMEPEQTRKVNAICPVCHRPMTVGVLHRVMELADRHEPLYPDDAPRVYSLIPLSEVLGEILSLGPATKGVKTLYSKLINKFGSEFTILLKTPIEDLNQQSPILGEAVKRIRTGKVIRHGGFDGEFGFINVFEKNELDDLAGQISLFRGKKPHANPKKKTPPRAPLPKIRRKSSDKFPDTAHANDAQLQATRADAKRILVTAGPGTGKTFTLVARIVHLISHGAAPENFAAITFTNRAANEVKERLRKEVGDAADIIFIGTFHGFCLAWLRRHIPDISVIGPEERTLLLKKLFPRKKRQELADLNAEISHLLQQDSASGDTKLFLRSSGAQQYFEEIRRQNLLDIDGIIPDFVAKIQDDPLVRDAVSRSIKYLFVDEFQDINKSQYQLTELLAKHAEVFAIGDPNQAIYGFRGSDPNYFFSFGKSNEITSITLTENYRSAARIIEAATAVVNNNDIKADGLLKPHRKEEGCISLFRAPTPKAEAEFVVKKIEELLGGVGHFSINTGRSDGNAVKERSFSDIAILYRLTGQADVLKEALERRGIPIQLVGSPPFFMAPAIRNAYYWIKAAAGKASLADQFALLRLTKTLNHTTLDDLERSLPINSDMFADASGLPLTVDRINKITELINRLNRFKSAVNENGLTAPLQEAFKDLGIALSDQNAQRFIELAAVFGKDLQQFATHLEQHSQATIYDDRAEAVSLMTLHSAKGLEFPVVFITGLEEGMLPYTAGNHVCDVEEERRLFYVGMTRAKEELILTSAANRTMYGKKLAGNRSSFLSEIPEALYEIITEKNKQTRKRTSTQMKLF